VLKTTWGLSTPFFYALFFSFVFTVIKPSFPRCYVAEEFANLSEFPLLFCIKVKNSVRLGTAVAVGGAAGDAVAPPHLTPTPQTLAKNQTKVGKSRATILK